MNANEAEKLIDGAGGDSAFARKLGIPETQGFQQRINNWKRRGIPSSVLLKHYDAFQKLKAEIAATATVPARKKRRA